MNRVRYLLVFLSLIVNPIVSKAVPDVFFVAPFPDTSFCVGDTMKIVFDTTGAYGASNMFTFRLSDTSGDFTRSTNLGTADKTGGNTFYYVIPNTIAPGRQYRLRIEASSPLDTSADNGYDIKIGMYAANVAADYRTPACTGDTLKLVASSTTSTTGLRWIWSGPNGFVSMSKEPIINNAKTQDVGNYIVAADIYGCVVRDTVTVNITQGPLPVIAVSNSPICVADTIRLFANSSNTDASYTWIGPSGFTASSKDTFIATAGASRSGDYIVSSRLNGCTRKDTVSVFVNQYPAGITMTGTSQLCIGDTAKLVANSGTSGVAYSWVGPNSFVSNLRNPVIPLAATADSGDYVVSIANGNCVARDTFTVNILRRPATPVPVANNPVCVGQSIRLSTPNAVYATGYSWNGPSSFISSSQNPVIENANISMAGQYYVVAHNAACTSSPAPVTITVRAKPEVVIEATPGDSICAGTELILQATPSMVLASKEYVWYRNNLQISYDDTSVYETITAANGDGYYCVLTAYGVCADPVSDTSNIVNMTVIPYQPTSVAVAYAPQVPVGGQRIVFRASPVNGGDNPQYQWLRNGANIPGAVADSFVSTSITDGDSICVLMTSNYVCPSPKIARGCIAAAINTTGILPELMDKKVNVYPNPVDDELMIDGLMKGTRVTLISALGQNVYSGVADQSSMRITTRHLSPGAYLLQIYFADGTKTATRIMKQ